MRGITALVVGGALQSVFADRCECHSGGCEQQGCISPICGEAGNCGQDFTSTSVCHGEKCSQMHTTSARCLGGACAQILSHAGGCDGGKCNQTEAKDPSCGGGKC